MAEIVGALKVGTILKGDVYEYRVVRVLGQGAFGITYLCSTMMGGTLGRVEVKVAVKEFFAKELNSRDDDGTVHATLQGGLAQKYMAAFKRESQNLSRMKSAGIVNVLEAFEANGTVYYSMEYLSGGTLDAFVRDRGMPERAALQMIQKICRALAYMHEKKMMHLDLKPKNIMLRDNGTPILIDFGLSKQYTSNGEPESSSTIGLGTPGFAPIEQANQNSGREFQPTIDIYAIGASMYEILTGKLPPTASEILNDGFPRQDLEALGVSAKTMDAVESAMSPIRKQRPQTVDALLKTFEEAEKDLGEPSEDELATRMDFPDEETGVAVPSADRRPSQSSGGTLPDSPQLSVIDSAGQQWAIPQGGDSNPSQGRQVSGISQGYAQPQPSQGAGFEPGTERTRTPDGGYVASQGGPSVPRNTGGHPTPVPQPVPSSQVFPVWLWPVSAVSGLVIGILLSLVI